MSRTWTLSYSALLDYSTGVGTRGGTVSYAGSLEMHTLRRPLGHERLKITRDPQWVVCNITSLLPSLCKTHPNGLTDWPPAPPEGIWVIRELMYQRVGTPTIPTVTV